MKTKVYMIESEFGWGQRIDEILEFDTQEEALQYCKDYNNKHNPPKDETLDWYMYAEIQNQTEYGMIR